MLSKRAPVTPTSACRNQPQAGLPCKPPSSRPSRRCSAPWNRLDDPLFLGVVLRSIALVHPRLRGPVRRHHLGGRRIPGRPARLARLVGRRSRAASAPHLLAVWLFVPVALLIATLYIDRVAAAVDRRYYPAPAPSPPAPTLAVQAWDGIALGARVLGSCRSSPSSWPSLLPGLGPCDRLGHRRLGHRPRALRRRRHAPHAPSRRHSPLRQPAARRFCSRAPCSPWPATIPLLNLLVPVLGVAALTHVLNAHAMRTGAMNARALPKP